MAAAVKPREDRRLLGIGLALLGYLCFCICDSCAKWLTLSHLPTIEVVFVRYLGQFVIVLAAFAPRQGVSTFKSNRPLIAVLRGLALMGSTLANFFALAFIPLTVTASINFTMPLVLAALSIPMLGERIGFGRWVAIVVGFLGVLIIVRPGTTAFHPVMIVSFLGVICNAFYLLFTRKLAGVDPTTTQQFFASGLPTLCLLPFAFSGWVWPSDPVTWITFFGIGAAAMAGHQAIVVAHRFAPASVLAPFNYSLIVYMSISSAFVFGQPPDHWIFLGAPIVIASGLYIWMSERRIARAVVADEIGAA